MVNSTELSENLLLFDFNSILYSNYDDTTVLTNMTNKKLPSSKVDDIEFTLPKNVVDRRKKSRSHDKLYQIMAGINVLAWIVLMLALIVFHYARPEFITGVQNFWGIEGRDFWAEEHLGDLLTLLQICLFLTIVTIVLRAKRNRRKMDRFGVNILILLIISITSLVTIYLTI
ncbi:hypothetical protein [Glaciecola petra]|uniref:Uncharacterized protein n=1 Tax=Glaciecola petra TaxID=3075602 RepID=A0ABU2ZPU8_9ALTE|nr:hypothetical protein [Aestuariibacter sp. P117]MDT0594647.1 hypothetical protein [Aestuariibacter sp. P117]